LQNQDFTPQFYYNRAKTGFWDLLTKPQRTRRTQRIFSCPAERGEFAPRTAREHLSRSVAPDGDAAWPSAAAWGSCAGDGAMSGSRLSGGMAGQAPSY